MFSNPEISRQSADIMFTTFVFVDFPRMTFQHGLLWDYVNCTDLRLSCRPFFVSLNGTDFRPRRHLVPPTLPSSPPINFLTIPVTYPSPPLSIPIIQHFVLRDPTPCYPLICPPLPNWPPPKLPL